MQVVQAWALCISLSQGDNEFITYASRSLSKCLAKLWHHLEGVIGRDVWVANLQ